MPQDPREAALIDCLKTAREQIIDYVLNPQNGVCGTANISTFADQLNAINQLLLFLKAK